MGVYFDIISLGKKNLVNKKKNYFHNWSLSILKQKIAFSQSDWKEIEDRYMKSDIEEIKKM